MEPVIRNVGGANNPFLGIEDGVPNYVMLSRVTVNPNGSVGGGG